MAAPRARPLSATLVVFVVVGATVSTCGGKRAEAPPAAEACPYHTVEEWQAFVDRWGGDARWGPTCEEGECDAAFHGEVDGNVRKVFEACADVLAARPGLAACTANLRRFAPAWIHQHSADSYGFAMDNRAYFATQEGPREPAGMMTVPAELVQAIPDVGKLAAAAREHGWKYLEQESCLGASRLFVLIPDPAGRFDQWALINLEDYTPGSGRGPVVDVKRTLSFIAVQQKDVDGAALGRVRLHFRDYRLEATADGGAGAYRLSLDATTNTKCFSCHPSGTRQLIPRPTSFLHALPVRGEAGFGAGSSDVGPERLAELNARLASYGLPDWGGLVSVQDLGPVLGKDVGCTACHDGLRRGFLTVMTSESQLDEKISYEMAMPPDAEIQRLVERSEMNDPKLTASEEKALREADHRQRALDDQVQASRLTALKDWLLMTRCR